MNLTRDIFGTRPKFGVLIDPDFEEDERFDELLAFLSEGLADVVLVGGSSSHHDNIDRVIHKLKEFVPQTIILFPGNSMQLSSLADGLLLPSLISGRNPDYLIGKHVEAASIICESGIPVFSMGYIMIDGGNLSTASYITQTLPIPSDQVELAVQTALAGQLLGMKCIYLEAGSGAKKPINTALVRQVKRVLNIPLIVGGGIKEKKELISIVDAGADMVIVGTVLEENPGLLSSFYESFVTHVAI